LAKDTPGFIVNRVARPFYSEAIKLYEEGVANIPTIDWALKTIGGFRMGPFELTDLIGHDVNYVVTETVWSQFFYDPRFKPSITQKRLLEAGLYGRKSKRGFYDYSEGANNPAATEDETLGNFIVDRILAMLINEAADAVFLNIASIKDIDLAMTKGVNYPKGLLAWADEIGISTIVKRLNTLYEEYGDDRYRACPLLKRMAKTGSTFYGD
jgi:3-hydroxybutyryl-CoA dehydrogenase